jgi:hypothetical protein
MSKEYRKTVWPLEGENANSKQKCSTRHSKKDFAIIKIVIPLVKHTVLPSDITNDLTFGYPYYTSLYVPFLGGRRFIQISHDSSPLTLT